MTVVVIVMRVRMKYGVRMRMVAGVCILQAMVLCALLGVPRVVAFGRARRTAPLLRHGRGGRYARAWNQKLKWRPGDGSAWPLSMKAVQTPERYLSIGNKPPFDPPLDVVHTRRTTCLLGGSGRGVEREENKV